MKIEEIDAIPRKSAKDLLAAGEPPSVLLEVEQALNLEWWRGYHAAIRTGAVGTTPPANRPKL
jgi:hypothetical protein